MGKPAKQGAADGNTRILRWAAASALIGVFLIYNSVDAASQNTPSVARPTASAPASISEPESDTSNEDEYADSSESQTAPESRPGPALPRSPRPIWTSPRSG